MRLPRREKMLLAMTAFRRFFRTKRPFKLTGPGWVFILYTIGVGAGAINTGNNLLYLVFGVFLGLLIASGFLSDLSLWGLNVEPRFPVSAVVGSPVSTFLTLTNEKKRLPSLCANVTLEGVLGGQTVQMRVYTPFIAPRDAGTSRAEWTPLRRGRFELQSIRLSTRYPFGLLEKWWRLRLEAASFDSGVFVTPRLYELDLRNIAFRSSGDDAVRESLERGDGATMLGLRTFAPGDNPRRIHWRASAKRALAAASFSTPWLVKEMDKDLKDRVLFLCPSVDEAAALTADQSEELVSFLASAVACCRANNIEPLIAIAGVLVVDETAFFSLWQPARGASPELMPYVETLPQEIIRQTRRSVLVMEAFHVAGAR